ncbi:hypothetical protein [Gelidibacter sp.]|uniref:hypothetical protein n=1 Tax=Gelidibacter sp. TaxID=2018083 RepID=UPI0032674E7C
MKTLLITFLLIGFAQFSHSQTDFAYTETSNLNLKNKNESIPNFKNSNEVKYLAEKSKKLEGQAFNYDIKSAAVYASHLKTTYSVSFTEGKNRIDAIYDADGKLLQSEGTYENVAIPYAIGSQLAKAHPGWEFHKSWCTSNYKLNSDTDIIYKIQLKKGNKTKVVKVNPLDYGL